MNQAEPRWTAQFGPSRVPSDSIRQLSTISLRSSREPREAHRSKRNRMRVAGIPPLNAQPVFFDAATPADPLTGLAGKLPDTCRNCGDLIAIVRPGKPPHCASLLCRSCGMHRGWLSRANYTFLCEVINKFGAPTEPIVFRSRSTKPEENGDGISVVQNGMRQEKNHANNC
jgi:hypothetical protein